MTNRVGTGKRKKSARVRAEIWAFFALGDEEAKIFPGILFDLAFGCGLFSGRLTFGNVG